MKTSGVDVLDIKKHVESLESSLNFLNDLVDKLHSEKASLVAVNKALKTENCSLSRRVSELEQHSRMNNIEIRGDAKRQATYVDVGEPLSVEQLFNGIRSAFSEPLNFVIHCAGILRTAPLSQCTDELFDDIVKTELKGTFLVKLAAVRNMLRSGTALSEWRGAIVNISSLAGKCGSVQPCAYSAAKAGVVALTKSAASELAKHSLKRTGQPMEIAEAMKFLCSPTTSSFITGTALEVTGGFKI
ncbi:(3R)-3-hydroxyacyl-CoA dehydrogenase-like [Dermacentor variabilis]|uniref:(3R)-3-hydroxyacyl-CoA dehydrogenase-like n=1 Tax=Dermacentor variabilis TaxID=34621 RepID=UPI003F5C849D